MTVREVRAMPINDAEVRKSDGGNLTFTGHAAVFNQRTWIGPKKWGFYEEVAESFFDDVLDDRAAFLVNHDPNIVLARNGNTMTLSIDKKGLLVNADWDPADPDAVKWAGRVRRGDVSEMSFAFTVAEETWSEDDAGNEIRTLVRAERLYDGSLVTYPAYEGTDAGMRDQAAEVVKRHRGFDPREPSVNFVINNPTSANTANSSSLTLNRDAGRITIGGRDAGPDAEPLDPPVVPAVRPDTDSPIPTSDGQPPVEDSLPVNDEPNAEVVEKTPEGSEPVTEPAEDVQRSLRQLRHRALAARHHLPL